MVTRFYKCLVVLIFTLGVFVLGVQVGKKDQMQRIEEVNLSEQN